MLDEFLKAVAAEKEMQRLEMVAELEACRIRGVLDPLIEKLARFTDNNDLTNQLSNMFDKIDEDGSGGCAHKYFSCLATPGCIFIPAH